MATMVVGPIQIHPNEDIKVFNKHQVSDIFMLFFYLCLEHHVQASVMAILVKSKTNFTAKFKIQFSLAGTNYQIGQDSVTAI